MSAREHLGNLVRGIQADVSCCAALLPLLTEQQRLLARQDSDNLATVGENIAAQLRLLENNARVRIQTLKALGLAPDAEGMQRLLAKLPSTAASQLERSWRQLELELARCQALNERNGELLAQQRMALAELTGLPLNRYGEPR